MEIPEADGISSHFQYCIMVSYVIPEADYVSSYHQPYIFNTILWSAFFIPEADCVSSCHHLYI